MHTSVRIMREKQPVPASPPAGEKRDLVAEQVNRIGEPTPAAIVNDAPSTFRSCAHGSLLLLQMYLRIHAS